MTLQNQHRMSLRLSFGFDIYNIILRYVNSIILKVEIFHSIDLKSGSAAMKFNFSFLDDSYCLHKPFPNCQKSRLASTEKH